METTEIEKLSDYEQLQKDFLELYKNVYCGYSAGSGWYELIKDTSRLIKHAIENVNNPLRRVQGIQVRVAQVKEKFGGLRYYYDIEMPESLETLDAEQERTLSRFIGEVAGVVAFAESMSFKICESCGTNREVISTGRWIQTLCKECRVCRNPENVIKKVEN